MNKFKIGDKVEYRLRDMDNYYHEFGGSCVNGDVGEIVENPFSTKGYDEGDKDFFIVIYGYDYPQLVSRNNFNLLKEQ